MLYLPYSLIGPFAGVFIDRWSRRQILVWSALIRAGFVAASPRSSSPRARSALPLYLAALAVLGVNRFFLSALSAALPHVVADDKLVMANSVAPDLGHVVAFVGGIIGLGVRLADRRRSRPGRRQCCSRPALCYLLAGLAPRGWPRGLLGPDAATAARGQRAPRAAGRAGTGWSPGCGTCGTGGRPRRRCWPPARTGSCTGSCC